MGLSMARGAEEAFNGLALMTSSSLVHHRHVNVADWIWAWSVRVTG